MICPYCQSEMRKGELTGDGRRGVTWWPAECPSWNRVLVAKSTLSEFKVETFYCSACQKMIIDTGK